ncbi:MAG: response regulator transcription factor [Elusimicrobiota bacterium]
MAQESRRILLIEDDAETRSGIESMLIANGYEVLPTDLLSTGWHLFTTQKPDLVILDLGLPDGSGLDFCQKLRDHESLGSTPVIMFTAQSGFDTKLAGFKAGADQYLTKPVAPKELSLWVEALLRRLGYDKDEGDVLLAGGCEIDLRARLVRFKGKLIPYLTCKEYELLYFLVKHQPQVLSRKQILSTLWHTVAVDHLVDTHLTNLRRKLPRELAVKIQAVPGKGYRFLP